MAASRPFRDASPAEKSTRRSIFSPVAGQALGDPAGRRPGPGRDGPYRWYSFLFNRRVPIHRSHNIRHEAEYNLDLLEPLGVPAAAKVALIPPVVTGPAPKRPGPWWNRRDSGADSWWSIPASLGSSLNASPEWYGQAGAGTRGSGVAVALTGTQAERDIIDRALGESRLPASRLPRPVLAEIPGRPAGAGRGFVGPPPVRCMSPLPLECRL